MDKAYLRHFKNQYDTIQEVITEVALNEMIEHRKEVGAPYDYLTEDCIGKKSLWYMLLRDVLVDDQLVEQNEDDVVHQQIVLERTFSHRIDSIYEHNVFVRWVDGDRLQFIPIFTPKQHI